MKRRTILLGIGTTSVGGSALLGTGAFSGIESHRSIGITVRGDASSYLELGPCLDDHDDPTPNSGFVVDDEGRIAIRIDDHEESNGEGEGVNADALTLLDDVFRVCNKGKQSICVDFSAEVLTLPRDAPTSAKSDAKEGDPTVAFYLGDDADVSGAEIPLTESDPNEDPAIRLDVGECACIGIRVRTYGIHPDTQLFPEGKLHIEASADARCEGIPVEGPPDDPEDPPEVPDDPVGASISNVTFFGPDGDPPDVSDLTVNVTHSENGDPTEIEWESESPIDEIVAFTGNNTGWFLYRLDDETEGTIVATEDAAADVHDEAVGNGSKTFPFVFDSDADGDVLPDDERCPSSPGFGGEVGIKFSDYGADTGEWGETGQTNETC